MAASAHQSHNLPWRTLAELLFAEEVSVNGIQRTRLRFKDAISEERIGRALAHFARRFASTISDFADTEAAKFACECASLLRSAAGEIDLDKVVYPDSLRSLSPILDRSDYQDVDYWKRRRLGEGGYTSSDGDLADVVKELFNLDQLACVLHLVRSGVQLQELERITYSNFFHYGIRCTLEWPLLLYLQFNILLAMDLVTDDPSHWPAALKESRQQVLSGHDHDAHFRVAAEWFKQEGQDFWAGWKHQMKFMFRCLYQYEVMSRELGRPVNWENEVQHVLGFLVWPLRWVPLQISTET